MRVKSKPLVTIDYTNWRGARALRRVRPVSISFAQSRYHPGPAQWIMEAFCEESGAMREFAMTNIHASVPAVFDVVAAE